LRSKEGVPVHTFLELFLRAFILVFLHKQLKFV
jgi:hypothetical protein